MLVFASAPGASADQTREDQWALKAFDAESIWKVSKGKGVTVAVIDEGVDAQHVDLKGNVIEGKDFTDGGSTTPENGDDHGTAMASIIAGHGHGPGSSQGVMGLAPEAKILDIRDLGNDDDGLASSIRYAVDHGASVINISQGGGGSQDEDAEPDAVAYALKHDVLVVASTGNDGGNVEYPGADLGVLAAGGVQNNGEVWDESNNGPEVLLTAPATHIVTAGGKANTNTSYSAGSGTSNSAAYVSAAAALLRAKFPKLTAGQVVNRLVKTAGLPSSAKGISLPDKHYGYGFIQPLAALTKDIPAGSKYGPLSVPESLKGNVSASADPSSKAISTPQTGSSTSSSDSGGNTFLWIGLGLVGILVLVVVILLIAKASRRNNGPGNGPGTPGYPPYGQQQPPYQPAPQNYPGYPPAQPNPYHQQPPSPRDSGRTSPDSHLVAERLTAGIIRSMRQSSEGVPGTWRVRGTGPLGAQQGVACTRKRSAFNGDDAQGDVLVLRHRAEVVKLGLCHLAAAELHAS